MKRKNLWINILIFGVSFLLATIIVLLLEIENWMLNLALEMVIAFIFVIIGYAIFDVTNKEK